MYHRPAASFLQRRSFRLDSKSLRWFATKRQQRLAAQQRADGTNSSDKKNTSTTSIQPPPPTTLIKTDLSLHVDYMQTQRLQFDPLRPPPDQADESGVVKRDLTSAMIDLTDIYDSRLHLNPTFDDSYESSTKLSDEMIQLLAVTNRPMTCAEYMRQALTHPLYGYYTNPSSKEDDDDDNWDDQGDDDNDWDTQDDNEKDGTGAHAIIGPRGDFVTAPEVSQVFGECLAVWFVTQWETLGKPMSFRLVEVGPGKGTLMADMVRASLESFPYFGSRIEKIHLVEASRAMREEQQRRLSEVMSANWVFDNEEQEKEDGSEEEEEETNQQKDEGSSDKPTIQVMWHDSFLDMVAATQSEETPAFVVCQEFIDALPVHVFEKTKDGWRERLVDAAISSEEEDSSKYLAAQEKLSFVVDKKPRLRLVVSPDTTPALRTLLNEEIDSEEGQVCEVCPEGILLAQDIAKFLEKNSGAALIVDYGQEGSGDTLRGFSNHKQVHVLSRPGLVDVTADVDFSALKHAVNHAPPKQEDDNVVNPPQAFGPVPQGQFLASMGIVERVSQLIDDDRTTDKQANDLYMALERLVLPEQMGERYKVLAISRKKQGMYPPAGFDTPRH